MQIFFYSCLCSYLPRVPILVEDTVYIYIYTVYVYMYVYVYIYMYMYVFFFLYKIIIFIFNYYILLYKIKFIINVNILKEYVLKSHELLSELEINF